jgi:endonuclease III
MSFSRSVSSCQALAVDTHVSRVSPKGLVWPIKRYYRIPLNEIEEEDPAGAMGQRHIIR